METDGKMEFKNETILGVDISSRSPLSHVGAKFSAVLLKDDNVVNKYSMVSFNELVSIIRKNNVTIIATDNIFEIFPNIKGIYTILSKLPSNIKIVQVTGAPPKLISLKILARHIGYHINRKLNSMETAEISARLASLGFGAFLHAFESETIIKISRGRSIGKGGQSANRYRRRLHTLIKEYYNELISKLKDKQLKFDVNLRESDSGLSSAIITVYSPYSVVRSIVHSFRTSDIRVSIYPVRKQISFVPLSIESNSILSSKSDFYILGLDAGTNIGIALVNFDGKVIYLNSTKNLSRSDLLRILIKYGTPVIVTSDVSVAPQIVKKIASLYSARIYLPEYPYSVSEKQQLMRDLPPDISITDSHERDALAAAIKAYNHYKSKLEQIDRKVNELGIFVDRNLVKALVLRGLSISDAINKVMPRTDLSEDISVESVKSTIDIDKLLSKMHNMREKYLKLSEEFEQVVAENQYLNFKISELEDYIQYIQTRYYKNIRRDRLISKLNRKITALEQSIHQLEGENAKLKGSLERLKRIEHSYIRGDVIPAKIVSSFSKESLIKIESTIGIRKNDIIFFKDASGGGISTVDYLYDKKIASVILNGTPTHLSLERLIELKIPFIYSNDISFEILNGIAYINRDEYDLQLQKSMEFLEEEHKKRTAQKIINIIEEYKRSRKDI